MSKPARRRPGLSPGSYATEPVMPVVSDTLESPAWIHLVPWMATDEWLRKLSDTDLALLLTKHLLLHYQIGTLEHSLQRESIERHEGRRPAGPPP